MTASESLFHVLDPVWPLMAATLGAFIGLCALVSEYSHIRKFGWNSYISDRSNLLRVAAATAITVLCAVGPIPAVIEFVFLDVLPGNPAGYGVLLSAGLFAALLRGFAPVPTWSVGCSLDRIRDTGSAGAGATNGELQ